MNLTELSAIGPIDGRYRRVTKSLSAYFSEASLIQYRIKVEVEYFIALANIPLPQLADYNQENNRLLRGLYINFTETDAARVKEIEKTTNHDVKAVEYFIKEKMDELAIGQQKEFIHFGLTSQDINNTAVPMTLKDGVEQQYIPLLASLIGLLKQLAKDWEDVSMLARTHGQPASPTRLGKEVCVFTERLDVQLDQLKKITYAGKFGGATGNFNAHHVAYPAIDWVNFANNFLKNQLTLMQGH